MHVGTAPAAEAIAAAGASCETCAHYLAFTEEDFDRLGASLKTAPPVKGRADREGLWKFIANGTISFLASDHAPAPESEKLTGDPLSAYGGIPGVGTGFPFLLSEGYLAGRLTLPRFLEASSGKAAERFGLSARKGSIAVGKDADFAFVDPASSWDVEGWRLFSRGKITPFEGMRFSGRVVATWVRGEAVFEDFEGGGGESAIVAAPGYGKYLNWGYR